MSRFNFRNTAAAAAGLLLVSLSITGRIQAQDEAPVSLNLNLGGKSASVPATNVVRHAKPSNTPRGRGATKEVLSTRGSWSASSKSDDAGKHGEDSGKHNGVRYPGL